MTDNELSSSSTASGIAINRNLTLKPFVKRADNNDTAVQWQKYKKEIERQFRFFGISDPETKKDGLLIYGGQDIVDILPDPTSNEGDNAYTILIRKIDQHFQPKQNKDFPRFQMSELKQNTDKRIADYYTRLREIAKKCDYGTPENDAIRDHLIQTMINNNIRSKAIRNNWVLNRILTEAALEEQTLEQINAISKKINDDKSHKRIKKIHQNYRVNRKHGTAENTSDRCGNGKTHVACLAIGASCNKCGKKNHFARVCRSKAKTTTPNRDQRQHRTRYNKDNNAKTNRQTLNDDSESYNPTRRTRYVAHQETDDSSGDDNFLHHLKTHHTSHSKHQTSKMCTIQINGVNANAEPDQGRI